MCMGYWDIDSQPPKWKCLFWIWLLTTLFLLAMSGVAEREAGPFILSNFIRSYRIIVHELK
jgi:hypothetical protein